MRMNHEIRVLYAEENQSIGLLVQSSVEITTFYLTLMKRNVELIQRR